MDIKVQLAFNEDAALRLLNWLARENALIFRTMDARAAERGERSLPGLYESGVRYEVEKVEVWSDYLNLLAQRHEDCDALAAARAGELLARGWRALRPHDPRDPMRYPGDGGYELVASMAPEARPDVIPAEVMLTTPTQKGRPGLYHCIVRYRIAGRWFRDDPSARLGMLDGQSAEASQGLASAHMITGPEEAFIARDRARDRAMLGALHRRRNRARVAGYIRALRGRMRAS